MFEKLAEEQIAVLEEFAKLAEELLQEEGVDYDEDDVVNVASFLIDSELDEENENEKTAEYYEAGAEMAQGCLDTLEEEDEE